MASAACIHSVSSSSSATALTSKVPAALLSYSCRLPSPCPFRPLLRQLLCSQGFLHLPRHPLDRCSLPCGKQEGALFPSHATVSMINCLSSFPSCPLSNLDQLMCKAPKRSSMAVAFAAADSDQSQSSSHEEVGEGTIGCFEGNEQGTPKKPSPEIKPGDVVQAQLQALREQDFTTVFEFASPKNKTHTGPLSKFAEMIQGRAYNVMLGHTSAKVLSTLSVGPERFQQRILIEGAKGKQAIFSWSLSKQVAEPYQDCWMTDSVHRDE